MSNPLRWLWDVVGVETIKFVIVFVGGWVFGLLTQSGAIIVLENVSYHGGWYLSPLGSKFFTLALVTVFVICLWGYRRNFSFCSHALLMSFFMASSLIIQAFVGDIHPYSIIGFYAFNVALVGFPILSGYHLWLRLHAHR